MKALPSLPAALLAVLLLPMASCELNEPPTEEAPTEAKGRAQASPNARPEVVDEFRRDLAGKRHPSDGGGRAWLEGAGTASAGTPGHWQVVFEAGPHGVAPGGMVFLMVSPFWGWSSPQVVAENRPGFTSVTTDAAGVELEPRMPMQNLLAVELSGRALEQGEQIRFHYGAGPSGALADRYAEHGSRFWVSVDGDGDGVRGTLENSPVVLVLPGPPARMLLTLPTTARPGQTLRLTVAILDGTGSAGSPLEGEVIFDPVPKGLRMPGRIRLDASDAGRKSVEVTAIEEGSYRLAAAGPGGLMAESNPLVVGGDVPRLLWADLQIHSNLSDGTGTPEDIYSYARDVAALDVAALTDHDHWGVLSLDQHPSLWKRIREQTRRFHQPGRFVTLLGFEWTSWIHGHRHVLYPGDEGEVLSSIDPRYDTPEELWDGLRKLGALTIAHHSAGQPIATNWTIPPDPELEPVTEIVSIHGSSEALDCPWKVRGALAGNTVRDALQRGYRLGFVGSGDGHDGHPGLAHLGSPTGGLAAIASEELTRAAVLAAIRQRRTYATSGPRIFLAITLDGAPMGSVLPPTDEALLRLRAVSTAPIEELQLIRSGRVAASLPHDGDREVSVEQTLHDLQSGEHIYLRLIQTDGGLAFSSPFFID